MSTLTASRAEAIKVEVINAIRDAETPSALSDALNCLDGIHEIISDGFTYQPDFVLAVASFFLGYDPHEFGNPGPNDEVFGVIGWCSEDGTAMTHWSVEGAALENLHISFSSLKKLDESVLEVYLAENFRQVARQHGHQYLTTDEKAYADYLASLTPQQKGALDFMRDQHGEFFIG